MAKLQLQKLKISIYSKEIPLTEDITQSLTIKTEIKKEVNKKLRILF